MNTLAGVQRIFELTRPALRAIPLVGQAVEGILESLLQLWRQAEVGRSLLCTRAVQS